MSAFEPMVKEAVLRAFGVTPCLFCGREPCAFVVNVGVLATGDQVKGRGVFKRAIHGAEVGWNYTAVCDQARPCVCSAVA